MKNISEISAEILVIDLIYDMSQQKAKSPKALASRD